MPANLPPEYFAAEKRYKEAQQIGERISSLEDLIATIPKHKGTDKLRADLRRRLSKLKDAALAGGKTGKHESVYHIEREGAGRAVLIGAPNVGKSSLITALTHARPKISENPFTTWAPVPGMMEVHNIKIQLIDTPALTKEHIDSELINLIRSSELILLVVDLQASPLRQLEATQTILQNNHIKVPGVRFPESDPRGTIAVPLIVVVNKNDDQSRDEDFQIFCELLEGDWPLITVSSKTNRNINALKETIYDKLDIIRVYAKPPGKEPDYNAPFVIKRGGTVEDFAAKVHKDFLANLKTARIWGKHVYDGQMVARDHVLDDGDVVELHL
jgi:ribosome-interacting GTPase 1